uniref:Uncharacterized protein n=1 Tax=Solibacter usitatus (strain Ellin6076) TaxID=234267 RepID=Q023G1_SOLUE
MPFLHRTMDDFARVLPRKDILAFLRERTTHTTGQLLTTSELSTFVHPPDQTTSSSTRRTFLQGLAVPQRLRGHGLPLGTNTDRGDPITVFQPDNQHNKSAWLIGQSRKGKSTMLIQRPRHLATAGHGVGVIDPHRSMARDLLGALDGIDPDRIVFLDFDATTPVAFNPFAHDDAEDYGRLTTEYVNSLTHLFDAERFHRMSHVLGMSIYALFVLKENLATLPALLAKTPAGESLRRRVSTTAKNDTVRRFWSEDYHHYPSDAFAPLTNRLSALLLDDKTHRTFAQPQTA